MPSDYDNDGLMSKFTIQAGSSAGNSYAQIFKSSYSITKDATYGISFYAKAKVGRRIEVGIIQADSPWANYVTATKTISVTNEWKRYEIALNATNTATDARIQLNTGLDKWNDELYIYKPQFEARNPTPFTATTRSALAKDYSINNSQATLQLSTSPRWVRNSMVGSGAYNFNGVGNVITTSNSFTLGPYLSACFWSNPTASSVREMVIHGDPSSGTFEIYQSNGAVALRGGSSIPCVVTDNSALPLNTWTYICGTINGTTGKIYINGKLKISGTVATPKTSSYPLNIGAYSDLQYPFNGLIDDVRLYNRVLSNDEVLQLYKAHNY
jgi:hypothetical protein